ncbi:hypothetical protein MC885_005492, partial [Smutsia gigantea]
GPKCSIRLGPEARVGGGLGASVPRPSAGPAQTSNLELGTRELIDRPTLHPDPQSRAELGPGQRWADPERVLASEFPHLELSGVS